MGRNRTRLALVVGSLLVVATLAGTSALANHATTSSAHRRVAIPPGSPNPGGDDTSGTLPPVAPVSGKARVLARGPATSGDLVLSFDDGDCEQCVGALVAGVERTGAHVTFCPNGVYGPATWDRYADRIRALIARGQVSICNHTWDHKDLTKLDPDNIRTELTRNEVWIEQTFGVSARPFFRPPYGAHNRAVDDVAAQLGYTDVLLWSGILGDSVARSGSAVLNDMRRYAKAGVIILGHANHPATASVFDDLVGIVRRAGLHLVTASEAFGAT